MKKILLCSDGSAFAENTYRYGAWFATQLKAEEVDVLCVTDVRGQQAISKTNLSAVLALMLQRIARSPGGIGTRESEN